MSNFSFHSDKLGISFESHLTNRDDAMKTSLIKIREQVFSLGDDVIEEVRPHRIVYAKSLTFRYFLDIYPRTKDLIISIRRNRKEPTKEYIIHNYEEFQKIETEISTAYKEI